jgi:Rrf2 family nitric oxide-sensitive transcriptional repressor
LRLTTFTDYTLRVLIQLSLRPGERTTIGEVASAFQISEHHLAKVVHLLGTSGWVENTRGRGGGMRLAVAPSEIRLDEVVKLTEGVDVPAECFQAGSHCVIYSRCRLKGILAESVRSFYATLSRYTLEDLIQPRDPLARLLFTPAARPRAAEKESASSKA